MVYRSAVTNFQFFSFQHTFVVAMKMEYRFTNVLIIYEKSEPSVSSVTATLLFLYVVLFIIYFIKFL